MNNLIVPQNEEKEVKYFYFNGVKLRILDVREDGKLEFIVKELCDSLNIKQPSRVVENLEEKHYRTLTYAEVFKGEPDSPLNKINDLQIPPRGLLVVDEHGLYQIVSRSDKPQAKPFQDLVFGEILPSIREHGSYSIKKEPQELSVEYVLKLSNQLIDKLSKENETLKISLDQSLKYTTIRKYNIENDMGWDLKFCQALGRRLRKYCLAQNIERKRVLDPMFGSCWGYPFEEFELVALDNVDLLPETGNLHKVKKEKL